MIHRIFLKILAGAMGVAGMLAMAETNLPASYVAAVQAVLRYDRVYPGEIDGVLGTQTVASIRRYQIVHGLRVTGRLDDPTLDAMHLPPPTSVAEEDRKFLRQLAASAPQVVGEPSVRPKVRATPTPAASPVSQEVVRRFLEKFLEAASRRDISDELAFFSPVVDYLDKGNLNRDSLQVELRRSRKNRPNRSYDLAGIRSVTASGETQGVVVQFTVHFRPANRKKRPSGTEEWEAGLVPNPDGALKITALHRRPPQ